MKYAFYPKGYINKEEEKKQKTVKASMLLFIILMILAILQLSLEIKDLKSIENRLNKKISFYGTLWKGEETQETCGVERNFYNIYQFIRDNNLIISTMNLSEEAICLTFQLQDKTDYSKLVSIIEKSFKIKTISPPYDYNEIFLVNLEIEKNEDL